MARNSKVRIENTDSVSGRVKIATGNNVKNINTIHQGVLALQKKLITLCGY